MSEYDYDVIVVGSGPGGEGAAMKACKEGKKVAVIEKYKDVGGGCTHWGTIPSKALRQAVQRVIQFNRNRWFKEACGGPIQLTFPQLLSSATDVIKKQVDMRTGFYERNNLDLIYGTASFIDNNTMQVVPNTAGKTRKISASVFVLAPGSHPYRPDDVDFNNPNIFDSDTILNLNFTPRSITIYGAGVIGSEYASIFQGLGVKVNLINTQKTLLAFLDEEIVHALSHDMRKQGVVIRSNEEYETITADDKSVVTQLVSGKKIKSDVFLWANGRTGNFKDLALEKVAIETNSRGQINVNENYQVDGKEHIYAIGDFIGYPSLASAAYDQGRFSATHIVDGVCDAKLVKDIPTGIYTNPEISSVGFTEKELTEQKIPYETGYSRFDSLARAQISGETQGLLKIIFHSDTLQILGVHCFGDQAAEIIHIGQAIMAQEGEANTLLYFTNTTFNYPTMAEAYRVAALNGLNRLDNH
ncbi:MAG: NAD(P)(+) transhydrogenase [Cycloclasticus sp. symbiont of Bathymodiolus heckerae]|nr:MAG: NAD(P)(+) transhydrogenase [Cycloclasticus sp. symbiont of Bathymodiolus heckerae]